MKIGAGHRNVLNSLKARQNLAYGIFHQCQSTSGTTEYSAEHQPKGLNHKLLLW